MKKLVKPLLRFVEIMVVAVIVFGLPLNGDLVSKAGMALAIIFAIDHFIRQEL